MLQIGFADVAQVVRVPREHEWYEAVAAPLKIWIEPFSGR
jgi:hypothetical protein